MGVNRHHLAETAMLATAALIVGIAEVGHRPLDGVDAAAAGSFVAVVAVVTLALLTGSELLATLDG